MSTGFAWLILFIAGLCEVAWAVGLKYTEGFSRLAPSLATVAAMIVSVVLLGWSLKEDADARNAGSELIDLNK